LEQLGDEEERVIFRGIVVEAANCPRVPNVLAAFPRAGSAPESRYFLRTPGEDGAANVHRRVKPVLRPGDYRRRDRHRSREVPVHGRTTGPGSRRPLIVATRGGGRIAGAQALWTSGR
jgi:hypothetical protein